MRLGIVARCDDTGLGNQTRQLVKMLAPEKILLINSFRFNKNKQHPEWYKEYNVQHVNGFPGRSDMAAFLSNLDVVISCETFYNPQFIDIAKRKNVKTILQYNYEFLDYLLKNSPTLPDVLVAPSLWNIDIVKDRFDKECEVVYLPPPTNHKDFESVKNKNISKDHMRLLHVGGKAAMHDRNGTNTIIKMLEFSKQDYQMVIKSQSQLELNSFDDRLVLEHGSQESPVSLYNGFDAMVLPRRYAGLCLPMNEALLSGLPVFMTDISPNNKILPKPWLTKSKKIGEFMTRAMLDIYDADPEELADKIDSYIISKNKTNLKNMAFKIGYENFSEELLKDKYIKLINK